MRGMELSIGNLGRMSSMVRSSVNYTKQEQICIKMMASVCSIKSLNDRSCKNDEAPYGGPATPNLEENIWELLKGFS